jgi:hypothetical protein
MTTGTHRPWRVVDASPALDGEAAKRWTDLLEESRRQVGALRDLSDLVQQRLAAGELLIHRAERRFGGDDLAAKLTIIEQRITLLEEKLNQITGETPLRLSPAQPPGPEPMQQLLRHIYSTAA